MVYVIFKFQYFWLIIFYYRFDKKYLRLYKLLYYYSGKTFKIVRYLKHKNNITNIVQHMFC